MKMKIDPARIINLIGRILLASVFLLTALVNKIPDFDHVVVQMAQEGVPFPRFMLIGAILFLLVGSLSLIVGFKARAGAVLLLIFTLSGTYFFHHFWTYTAPGQMQEHFKSFMKNVSISGGLLLIIANGPGAFSFDSQHSKKES
ncbi:DoxX family protein [Candidatus Electronema sp. PJ]|uniref:DoxX family protein n=1 Tax=Candidatus Electronema sp. PJ TaxID=3401572 RepID=UPI003AA8FCB7